MKACNPQIWIRYEASLRKDKPFNDQLVIVLNEKIDSADGSPKKLRKLAEVAVEQALAGNAVMIKEIWDRTDGKVPQAQIHQGDDDGGPISHAIAVSFVKAYSGDAT